MILIGCQKPVEEISVPEGNIQSNPQLVELLRNTLAFDGSFDNAIDNSSCISVRLPVDVVVNEQALTVSSVVDIQTVEGILNEQQFDYDTIRISFPITVMLPDYSSQVLDSQEDLDELRSMCLEGGEDADIECVDFQYPLRSYIYDSLNQLASTREFASDEEMLSFLSYLDGSKIATFGFPMTLVLADGSNEVVQNSTDLSALIEGNANSCDEEDVQFYNNIITVPFETGLLRLQLTDAPFPTELVAEANILINAIDIKGSDVDTLLNLSEEEFAINLLELTNGITVSLAEIEIPEGSYNEMRLQVEESSVLLEDGTLYDLMVPGDKIKVKIDPDIEIDAAQPVDLLLDFDVSRSFVVQGNPNTPAGIRGFLFKPVIKAVNLAGAGTLGGTVIDLMDAPLEGVQVSVFAADTLNTTSFTNVDGAYTVLGLLPGNYEIVAELDGYLSSMQDVSISAGAETTADFQLTEE